VMPLLFEFCSFKFLKSCIRTLLHFGFKLYSLIVPKFFSGCKGISLIGIFGIAEQQKFLQDFKNYSWIIFLNYDMNMELILNESRL
jgi:hypothetical protein